MEKLATLLKEHFEWSTKTFGAERSPIAAIKHLRKEVDELLEAALSGEAYSLREEMADVFLLLLDATYRSGYTFDQLVDDAQIKLDINKRRVWAVPEDPEEPAEHVR